MTRVKIIIETEDSSITSKNVIVHNIELTEDEDGIKRLHKLLIDVLGSPIELLNRLKDERT